MVGDDLAVREREKLVPSSDLGIAPGPSRAGTVEDHIRVQAPFTLRSGGDHHSGVNPGVEFEDVLDLAQFHPVAPDLDLMVDTAQELKRAVPAPANAIPRPVHALPGHERVLDEPLSG